MLDKTAPLEGPETEGQIGGGISEDNVDWLNLARDAYETSTDYLDSNYRKKFERNIDNFSNKHPAGSKYHSEAYKYRSRLFRPKTRTAIRGAEAAFAEAMFATREVVTVEPVNQANKQDDVLSEFWEAVLNYRLKHSIPWFLLSIGAYQESKIYGIIVSRQYWEEEGNKPDIKLLPIENCRFDSGADWTDPVNTSPYWIEIIPMYVDDVMAMIDGGKWMEYSREEVITAAREGEQTKETLRKKREGINQDPKDTESAVSSFQIVWVHRNFIKKDGQDYEFYTLSTNRILSDPIPVTPETHPIGRPYRVGISTIEAHKSIPASDVELAQDLQAEANDMANQRIDNVRLVLNKGYVVNRNANFDIATLKRSYPGRIVMTDNVDAYKPDEMHDVTGSAFAEQDRINHDMDDIMGGFSGSSVATNRQLSETVGGMQMFQQAGNKIQGYSVRTFVETWVEPVLSDIVTLCMSYESDQMLQQFAPEGQMINRQALSVPMSVCVSVGLGPLDPKERAKLIVESLSVMGKIVPQAMANLDIEAVSREIFGVIGYRDGSKFFKNLQDGMAPPEPQQQDPTAAIKAAELEIKKEDLLMRQQVEMARLKQDYEIKMMEMALKQELTLEQLRSRLDLDMDKLNLDILKEMGSQERIQRDREEMNLAAQTGQGI